MHGVPRVVASVLKFYLISLLRQPREGTVLARAAVRLSCTQGPTRRMYGMWARAPMPEVGRPVAAKLRGSATAGRLHAPCVAVRLFDRWLWRRWKGV
jgi:hypothetical protein